MKTLKNYGKVTVSLIVCLVLVWGLVSGFGWERPQTPNLLIYGMSGSAPYSRFIDVTNLKVWDAVGAAMTSAKDFDDTDVAMTSYVVNALTDNTSKLGGWMVAVPSALPDGVYDVLIYDSSSVASTDAIYKGIRCKIRGGKIIEMVDF